MREKFASTGTVVTLTVLACLFALHLLIVDPVRLAVTALVSSIGSWLLKHQLSGSDVIALLGVVGTFAAVVVALWIATISHRRTDREALARAQLAAASVSARLEITRDMIVAHSMTGIFLNEALPEHLGRIQALDRIRRAFANVDFRPSAEILLALTPLPNNCAHRIARAYDFIECVRIDLASIPAGKMFETMAAREIERMLERCTGNLMSADDLLRVALQECRDATEAGAPMPSALEIYGEPNEDD